MAKEKTHCATPEGGARGAAAAAAGPIRRRAVILKEPAKPSALIAEVAGGTAAECAAVCCCCPCVLVNLVVLTVVRLPAVVCQRALKAGTKRRAVVKKRKVGLLGPKPGGCGGGGGAWEEDEKAVGLHGAVVAVEGEDWPAKPPPAEAVEMEKEMWAMFHGAGFWRSPSQREEEERLGRNGIGNGLLPLSPPFPRSDPRR